MTGQGAVACGHSVTAAAAVEILEEGGNAFDAVIAAQFAACVVEPVLTSLGGGGFLLADHPGQPSRVFDFFVQTPTTRPGTEDALHPIEADFGPATQTFHVGPASVATPGTVAGMFTIHRALASLPMSRLVEPAVRAASTGVIVNDFQGYIFDVVRPIYESVPPYTEAHSGHRLTQPELAESLESLAREGEGLFYRGELGARLVAHCANEGGHLTMDDLSAYRVIERQPLTLDHRGYRVLTNPLPSAGGVLIGHSLDALTGGHTAPADMVQAMAATNDARESLLDGTPQVSRGTTHISVADRAGNVAAMTLSNGEGSGCVIPGTGIMLNNMLGEEDINPGGIGQWQTDVRLGSMMAPTLILGEAHRYALGSGGSNRIRSALLQVIVHLLDHQLEPATAVAAPRLHLEEHLLSLEPGFDPETITRLEGMPLEVHPWTDQNLFFGGVHLVASHDDGRFDAVGDTRRGGVGRLAGVGQHPDP